jgi:hypothetical protein
VISLPKMPYIHRIILVSPVECIAALYALFDCVCALPLCTSCVRVCMRMHLRLLALHFLCGVSRECITNMLMNKRKCAYAFAFVNLLFLCGVSRACITNMLMNKRKCAYAFAFVNLFFLCGVSCVRITIVLMNKCMPVLVTVVFMCIMCTCMHVYALTFVNTAFPVWVCLCSVRLDCKKLQREVLYK